VRALRSLITDLRPPVQDDHGLLPALAALADRMQSVNKLSLDLQIELSDQSCPEPRAVSLRVESACSFSMCECG